MNLKGGEKILDAGCGTAIMGQLILQYYPDLSLSVDAIDKSDVRINDLKRKLPDIRLKFPLSTINCKGSDLQCLDQKNNYYDLIICRFVYQHIPQIMKLVTEELYRVLRPGGAFILIETDGVFYNLDVEDDFVNQCLSKIKAHFPYYEGYICKKIPRILIRSGFKIEKFKHTPMFFFKEEDRKHEHQLWIMRFRQIRPYIEDILGKNDFEKFQSAYLREIMTPLNFLYYNKFVFFSKKILSL